ncbi:MAG: hypothetical protein ACPGVO_18240 [Spirulinaceae cyanobacterium]
MTRTLTSQHLSSDAIAQLVSHLPDYVKVALLEKSTVMDCPLEATIEMAIANFLDDEALSFEDCLLAQRSQFTSPLDI